MKIGFDVISDLNLSPDTPFDWEGKATSLYCIVAGNVSNDIRTVYNALSNLSGFYQGVFYIPGYLEYENISDIDGRTKELVRVCKKIRNVNVMYQHVVIIDGIAVLATVGNYKKQINGNGNLTDEFRKLYIQELHYLQNSIEKLQKHLDVTKIVVVSNSVPNKDLYFGEKNYSEELNFPLNICLMADTMNKVSHWVFGSYGKIVDTVKYNINYVCNPNTNQNPYWAKRLDVEV